MDGLWETCIGWETTPVTTINHTPKKDILFIYHCHNCHMNHLSQLGAVN